ncbi:HAD family acid phosphatase [uncultured Amnibacterium sp.]|uniref:HAD family acid phosphatase n=1 Tax=uncultured Amnibacterium sp. TaxID=1631851 RepID=UPI0035CB5711
MSDVLRGGPQYLEAHRNVRRPAIVLDIDNTALQSYYFGGAATPPVLAFEQAAVRAGYSVLFATGRPASTTGSVAALTKAGYRVDALCKRPSTKVKLQVSKARCRANWAKSGYTIVAAVGNRSTDFMGGNTGKVYALPNYGFLS